jgi:putative spermidine/putrescine transport system ATP-binding protein
MNSISAAEMSRSRQSAEPHVQFRNVIKTYDGKSRAVDGIDLDIAKGEFLTLLGPSGSGKTTTLMMLAGFETPTGGEIRLDGKRIDRMPPHRRGIGVVFQNYALFPHMTVAGNLAFPLEVRGVGRAERDERLRRLLEQVRLQGLEDRFPAQLSGGQQQRVAVARALVFGPQLVLMDEPLGALDKQLRESLQYEIKEVHRTFGVTIVYVTHDQSEALTMSDRIALFRAGGLEQVADPRTVYEEPATAFAARFIGETNILDGSVVERRGADVLVDVGATRPILARIGNLEGRKGERTSVCVRPEHLQFAAAASDGMNLIDARIIDAIFHGDHVRLRLAVEGGGSFTAKVPANRFDMVKSAATFPVHFDPAHCRALDPGSQDNKVRPNSSANPDNA